MKTGKLAEVFVFSNFSRVPVDEVVAGDICAVTGLSDVSIGETICNTGDVIPLPSISVRLFRLVTDAKVWPIESSSHKLDQWILGASSVSQKIGCCMLLVPIAWPLSSL